MCRGDVCVEVVCVWRKCLAVVCVVEGVCGGVICVWKMCKDEVCA